MTVATAITLIAFTNFLYGITTKWFLDFLHSFYPQSKIYCAPEELSDSDESDKVSVDFDVKDFYEDGEVKSIGVVTKVERFDEDVLQKFLRKQSYNEEQDPLGVFAKEIPDLANSFADGPSFANAGAAKHRKSIMNNKNIPFKSENLKNKIVSAPIPDSKDQNYLSPNEIQRSSTIRRGTITHNKIDSSMLRKLSVLNVSFTF